MASGVQIRGRGEAVRRGLDSEQTRRRKALIGILVGGLLCVFLGLSRLWPAALGPTIVIPPGTALTIKLTRPITSLDARLGEVFQASVVAIEAVKGAPVIPPGVGVEGRCVAVEKGQDEARPGYLRLALFGLRDSQGHLAALETTTFGRWGDQALELGSKFLESSRAGNLPGSQVTPPLASAPAGSPTEAVITPEAPITFVLLKPAVVRARRGQP